MKWAIWVPWCKMFLLDGDNILLFDTEEKARRHTGEGVVKNPCLHGALPPGCKTCWWQAVPWDAQAVAIASGASV